MKAPPGRLVRADDSVPHCRFEQTPDGFSCQFSHVGPYTWEYAAINKGFLFAFFGLLTHMVAIQIYGIRAIYRRLRPTRIVVDQNYVTIDDASIKRSEFGGFCIARTMELYRQSGAVGRSREYAWVGYTIGARTYEVGSALEASKAAEVVGALNRHLQLRAAAV